MKIATKASLISFGFALTLFLPLSQTGFAAGYMKSGANPSAKKCNRRCRAAKRRAKRGACLKRNGIPSVSGNTCRLQGIPTSAGIGFQVVSRSTVAKKCKSRGCKRRQKRKAMKKACRANGGRPSPSGKTCSRRLPGIPYP